MTSGAAPERSGARHVLVLAGGIAGIIFAVLIGRDTFEWSRRGGLAIDGNVVWGRDFANVWTAGRLTLAGGVDRIYDIHAYRAFQSTIFAAPIAGHNYAYPPVTLLYDWGFALPSYPVALAIWLLLSAGLFGWAAAPWLREAGLARGLVLLFPATLFNLWTGQYGLIVGALWLAGWRLLDRRPLLAGALLGLIVVKPHLALLLPLALARRRQWRAIAGAGLTVASLALLSLAVFGPGVWRGYLTGTAIGQARMAADSGGFFALMMPGTMPALVRLGATPALALAGQAVSALIAAAALWRWMPADTRDAGLATATATALCLPYFFGYDLAAASLGALPLLARPHDRSTAWIAGAAFALPVLVIPFNFAGLPIGPPVLAALLWRQLRAGAGMASASSTATMARGANTSPM